MSASQAAVLIEELRSLGVSLSPEGEQLRYRGSRGVITPDLLERIRARKGELLEILRAETPEDLTESEILETRTGLAAVRIKSRLLGCELWLAHDARTAAELRDEMAPEKALPILLFEDVPRLRGKSPAALRALLEVASVFPGSRFVT